MERPEPRRIERLCNLWGWWLFVASALCFIAGSLRSGDPVGLVGSLFFLVACFVFLYPITVGRRRHGGD